MKGLETDRSTPFREAWRTLWAWRSAFWITQSMRCVSGSGAQAASYIHLLDVKSGRTTYGVGISSNITRASIRGIFSAVNRLFYTEN